MTGRYEGSEIGVVYSFVILITALPRREKFPTIMGSAKWPLLETRLMFQGLIFHFHTSIAMG